MPDPHPFATPDGFEAWAAQAKQQWLIDEMAASAYTPVTRPDLEFPPPAQLPSALGVVLRRSRLRRTIDRTDDLADPNRVKVIHRQGTVAPVAWEVDEGSPFSGLFASSSAPVPGIVRMSLATPPTRNKAFIPGMGLKLLVDGRPSADTVAVNHTNGQGRDFNLFSNPLSHDLTDRHTESRTPQRIMAKLFERVTSEPRQLSISHFAAVTAQGGSVTAPSTPHRITFMPTRAAKRCFVGRADDDFRDVLAEVPTGTVLYEVVAEASAGGPERRLGEIRTTGPFVASALGDRLFFRHVAHPDHIVE